MAARAPVLRPRLRRPHRFAQFSFTGMRDSEDPTTADPRKAYLLQNVYPQDAEIGGGLVGRPGFQQAGSQIVGSGAIQAVTQFTELGGTEHTVAIAGGEIYTFDWSTRGWSKVISSTDLSGDSITLASSGRVYTVTFADALVVSDGTNTPFTWDGTTNGGLTKLTNAPVAYGRPAVYYAKLFFIKNGERSTIVWSEENAPNTGYEAGGYNNAWTLGQTEQEPLYRLGPTNDALYYWRARSTGAVFGAVTPEFSTTGTHEAVSQTIGTTSPDAVVQAAGSFWLLDADGRPQRLPIGGGYVGEHGGTPAWIDARDTVRLLPRDELPDARGAYWTPGGLVLLGVAGVNATEPDRFLAFDATTGNFAGIWRGTDFVLTALAMVKNGDLAPTLMHGSTDGSAYDWGTPRGSIWTDGLAAGAEAIEHIAEGTPLGFDVRDEKVFTRIDISLRMDSNMTDVQVSHSTPYGGSSELAVSATGGFSVWGEAVWDTDVWTGDALEGHESVGWNGYGRWIRPRVRHNTSGEQFGLIGWVVEALPAGSSPAAP